MSLNTLKCVNQYQKFSGKVGEGFVILGALYFLNIFKATLEVNLIVLHKFVITY